MKMKKMICSLMISILCFMTAISGVSAMNAYDTNKLLDASEKTMKYYKQVGLSDNTYFDDIIAYEALGGEAEDDLDISQFENQIYVGYLGSMAKGVIVAKLLQKDPTQLSISGKTVNLVKEIESMVDSNGCFGEQVGNNNEIWGLLALEAVSSSKIELVANHIASDINKDGGFWNFGYDANWNIDYSVKASSCDVTGWGIEALSIAGKEKYSSIIKKAIQYLKDNQGDEGFLSYGSTNPDTQACSVEGLSVYNRESLLNGDYDKKDKNPIDILLSFQNNKGSFWYNEAGEDNGYATQDAARALGTIINGSVIYKAIGSGNPDTPITKDEPSTDQPNTTTEPETTPEEPDTTEPVKTTEVSQPVETDKKATSVKTGDETNVIIYISLSIVSVGLFLVLKKEYGKTH